jgi:hypothetical protein
MPLRPCFGGKNEDVTWYHNSSKTAPGNMISGRMTGNAMLALNQGNSYYAPAGSSVTESQCPYTMDQGLTEGRPWWDDNQLRAARLRQWY